MRVGEVVVWIGVAINFSDGYSDFICKLPHDMQEAIGSGRRYEIDGLSFMEFESGNYDPGGIGVVYCHYEGIVSFDDILSNQEEIILMKEKIKEVMIRWGIDEDVKIYCHGFNW